MERAIPYEIASLHGLLMNLPTSLFNIPRQKSLQSKNNLAKGDLLVVAVQGSHPSMNLLLVVVQDFHLVSHLAPVAFLDFHLLGR